MQSWSRLRIACYAVLVLAAMLGTSRLAKSQQATEPPPTAHGPNSTGSESEVAIQPRHKGKNGEEENVAVSGEQRVARLGRDFLEDQKEIWTSPAKVRFPDTEWLVPLSGITAGLFVTDSDVNRHLSHNPSTISHYKNMSDVAVGALIGGAGGMWLLGHVKHNAHWTETGFLSGEAALNSLLVVESLKYSLRRERPLMDNANGSFFQHGGTSFPSEHAAAAWSVAGVIAHEYPGPLTKIVAYGLASMVDVARIRGQQHFPSDVLVGTVLGNLIAQNIYSRRHDDTLGGDAWRSISQIFRSTTGSSPANQGSPYVPLDSWIYPALDRLIGMGIIDSEFYGMRPWTRSECVRMLTEAADRVDTAPPDAQKAYGLLESEFKEELEGAAGSERYLARLESVYTRVTEISGKPLNLADGYMFGQTLFNDFGRPYEEGFNSVTGFSAWTTAGRWVGYVRGEYQQSPSAPALPESARLAISEALPFNPVPPATPISSISQFQLLDAYVGLNIGNWQTTFGKQSLWWGPGNGGPMDLSNNAPPIEMFRINRITPLRVPLLSRLFGPVRLEFFLGQLTGHEFILNPTGFVGQYGQSLDPQPFMHGEKFTFRPTRNFEFGFFRTTIFGGEGYPFTMHSFIHSLFDIGNTLAGAPNKPGKRTSGLDFNYRLPGLRNWLAFYGDGVAWDQFSPIAYADRSAWRGGLYLSHFPFVPKLDLRVEGVYTDLPIGGNVCCGFFYFDGTWRSGYTNGGDLMGSWVGRDGQGAQAWSNYWFSPRNRLQFNFRHQKVSQQFIPGGGSLTDVGVRTDYSVRPDLSVSLSVQHERWLFPCIQPNVSHNLTTAIEILFEPHKLLQHSAPGSSGDLP